MNVQFGTCSADPAMINKNSYITLNAAFDAQVKDNSTIINPTIIVRKAKINPHHNYAYIEEWGRYYYITNMRFTTGDRVEVDLSIDVLYTYRSDINNMEVYISRIGDEEMRAAYINDPSFPMTEETFIHNYEFQFGEGGNPFAISADLNTKNYILTVIGGRDNS